MVNVFFLYKGTSYHYISTGEDRNMVLTVGEGGGLFVRKKLPYIDYNQLWNVAGIINSTGGHLINKADGHCVQVMLGQMFSESNVVVDNINANHSANQLWYYSNGRIFNVIDDLALGVEKKDGRIAMMKLDMSSPLSHIWMLKDRMTSPSSHVWMLEDRTYT